MSVSGIIRMIRRRWVTIFVVASIVLIVGAAITALMPKRYASQVQFWISTSQNGDTAELAQGSTFLSRQIVSYAQLLKTPVLLQNVIDTSGVDTNTRELARATAVSNPPGSVLLVVTVELPSSEDATRLAQAYSDVFPSTVNEVDRVGDQTSSPVKVSVVGRAETPARPSSPNVSNNLMIALIIGLLLGLIAAQTRQLLDSKIRTKRDVEETIESPVIGGVPFDPETATNPLVVAEGVKSKRAEAYRSLRTNLQFVDIANHPHVIVVTSSLPGEGKSTTIANLGLALVRSGRTVCVVEADLRRPKLLEYLGMTGVVGLTDVLIGKYDLDDVVQTYGTTGLAVVGSGSAPPNPSELLGSTVMVQTLRELSSLFDYVLLDGAPLLPVTDSAVLAGHADGVVLVAGSGMVSRDQLSVAAETLHRAQAKLLGVVLNMVPKSAVGGASYDYYYGGDSVREHAPDTSVRAAPRRNSGGEATSTSLAGATGRALAEGRAEPVDAVARIGPSTPTVVGAAADDVEDIDAPSANVEKPGPPASAHGEASKFSATTADVGQPLHYESGQH